MKAVRVLKKEMPLIYAKNNLEDKDISFIFSKVREIFENVGKYKTLYPQLNLFCNWCLHSRLSGSITIFKYLLSVSERLSKLSNPGVTRDETDRGINFIANILDFPAVRKGLGDVLTAQGIDAKISTDDAWWGRCVILLLREISEKPLEFPEAVVSGAQTKGRAFEYFSKIQALPEISIQGINKIIRIEVRLNEKNIYEIYLDGLSKVRFIVEVRREL